MKTCLIIVDLQKDYFPGGTMELHGTEQSAAKARLLLDQFRIENRPIIHIQHISARPGATFFLPGTEGVEIHASVAPEASETVIRKNYPNSFRETPLLATLQDRGISNLVVCGAMSHMCIDATTRAAFDLGFTCVVAEDACATRDLAFKETVVKAADVHAAFMAALSVPYATVTSTADVIKNMASGATQLI